MLDVARRRLRDVAGDALVRAGPRAGRQRMDGQCECPLAAGALPEPVVRRLYEAGVERVNNLYGPTEDTTYATYGEQGRGEGGVTIGRAISNSQVYLLGREGEVVGEGQIGEIYLGGAGVARGYVGRAEQTAARFVPDEFSKEEGRRLYRTGDIGRWRRDGDRE